MSLPELTDEPVRLPGLCPSVSQRLLATLVTKLFLGRDSDEQQQQQLRVLSIGCGNGLFEALLQDRIGGKAGMAGMAAVVGVEVLSAASGGGCCGVRYLDKSSVALVKGTWEVYGDAGDAAVWIWVYPRDPRLLRK